MISLRYLLLILLLLLIEPSLLIDSELANLMNTLLVKHMSGDYLIEGLSKIPEYSQLSLHNKGKVEISILHHTDEEYLFRFAFSSEKLRQDFSLITQLIDVGQYKSCLVPNDKGVFYDSHFQNCIISRFSYSAQLTDVYHFIQTNPVKLEIKNIEINVHENDDTSFYLFIYDNEIL